MRFGDGRRWIPAMICIALVAAAASVTQRGAARGDSIPPAFDDAVDAEDTFAVEDTVEIDSVDAGIENVLDMFLAIPDNKLDILPMEARLYMYNYLEEDSLVTVRNAFGGESSVTEYKPGYLRLNLTAVSSLQIKQLPYRGSDIFMTIYTVASDKVAADSEVSFYDNRAKLMKREKIFPTPEPRLFWNIPDDKEGREKIKEMLAEVPFYAVEYSASPDNDNLTGRVSSISFLPEEQKRILLPQLRDSLSWGWDGRRYRPLFKK